MIGFLWDKLNQKIIDKAGFFIVYRLYGKKEQENKDHHLGMYGGEKRARNTFSLHHNKEFSDSPGEAEKEKVQPLFEASYPSSGNQIIRFLKKSELV